MLALLRVLAILPMMFAARLRRIERRAIERLKGAGADTAERAILLQNSGVVSDFVYRRLGKAGAIVPANNDRYYLNERAYETFRGRRRRRAVVAVMAVLVIIAVLYAQGVIK
jgi:hypothetical protein